MVFLEGNQFCLYNHLLPYVIKEMMQWSNNILLILKELLAPRAARNTKSYAEPIQPEINNKQKKRIPQFRDRNQKRSTKVTDASSYMLPMIDGAVAQVRGWSYGNLTKKDASHFTRAVMLLFLKPLVHFHILQFIIKEFLPSVTVLINLYQANNVII